MWYTAESAHGSSTSYGFSNDTIVRVWNSRQARDNYVDRSSNISVEAIRRDQVTKNATNYNLTSNNTNAPRPFYSEFWAICVDDYDTFFVSDNPGYVGIVECSNEFDHNIIKRFYS